MMGAWRREVTPRTGGKSGKRRGAGGGKRCRGDWDGERDVMLRSAVDGDGGCEEVSAFVSSLCVYVCVYVNSVWIAERTLVLVRYTFYTQYIHRSKPPRVAMTSLPSHNDAPPSLPSVSSIPPPGFSLSMTSPTQQTPPQSITRGPTSPPKPASPTPHPTIISAPSEPLTGSPFTSQVFSANVRSLVF